MIHTQYARKGYNIVQRSPNGAAHALIANLSQVDWTVMSEEEEQRQKAYLKPIFAETTSARNQPEVPKTFEEGFRMDQMEGS